MKLTEVYDLKHISIFFGKRILTLHTMPNSLYIAYQYADKKVKTKDLSVFRYIQFCDKHRGKRTKGYNRPCITIKEYDTKENQ